MKIAILITSVLLYFAPTVSFAETVEDYTEARLAIASKPGFNPYKDSLDEFNKFQTSQRLLDTGKYMEGIKIQLALPKEYPLSIFSNMVAGDASRWLASTHLVPEDEKLLLKETSDAYYAKADLLHKSITNNTECNSIESECKVISIQEENMILKRLRYQKVSQELILDKEKKIAFDKLVGKNKDGELKTFYFDIWLLTPGNPNTLTHHSSGTLNSAP